MFITFCHNLIFGEKLNIEVDKEVKLIFINNLIKEILNIIKNKSQNRVEITEDISIKVSGVKKILVPQSGLADGIIEELYDRYKTDQLIKIC